MTFLAEFMEREIMRVSIVAAALLMASPVVAQTNPIPTHPLPAASAQANVAPVQLAPAGRFLPGGTQVSLTPMQEISSKHTRMGERFQFQVVNDVVEKGLVVIPRGSIAIGVVSMKTGRAVGGKSGKFDISFESVTANGVTFPLSGIHRQEGKGNTLGALFGSLIISGRSAVMLPGQIVTAIVKEQTAY